MRIVPLILVFLVACGDDGGATPDAGHDASSPDAATDAGMDAEVSSDAGRDAASDATPDGCTALTIDRVSLAWADDVSIAYAIELDASPPGGSRELQLIFERYMPGPDVGTFPLGGDTPDGNYGTCAHCVVIPGPSPERGYFADRGTLVTRTDPYTRRLDASVTNLRLIEVDIALETRSSTPVPDGRCVEIADFDVSGTFPPEAWLCDAEDYGDGEACHCECGDFDPDCGGPVECFPGDPGCVPSDALPIADCSTGDLCGFDPVLASTRCTATCVHASGVPCDTGVCVFDFVGDGADTCWVQDERIADATVGEPCGSSPYARVCNVVSGIALGYCDHDDVCRGLCASPEQCTTEGFECQPFFFDRPEGHCGPPFSIE